MRCVAWLFCERHSIALSQPLIPVYSVSGSMWIENFSMAFFDLLLLECCFKIGYYYYVAEIAKWTHSLTIVMPSINGFKWLRNGYIAHRFIGSHQSKMHFLCWNVFFSVFFLCSSIEWTVKPDHEWRDQMRFPSACLRCLLKSRGNESDGNSKSWRASRKSWRVHTRKKMEWSREICLVWLDIFYLVRV